MPIGANTARQLQGHSPGWTGPVTETLDASVLNSDPTSLFDSPARLIWCIADGNLDFTLWGDDTADATKKNTRAMKAGDLLAQFAVSKIWASVSARRSALSRAPRNDDYSRARRSRRCRVFVGRSHIGGERSASGSRAD